MDSCREMVRSTDKRGGTRVVWLGFYFFLLRKKILLFRRRINSPADIKAAFCRKSNYKECPSVGFVAPLAGRLHVQYYTIKTTSPPSWYFLRVDVHWKESSLEQLSLQQRSSLCPWPQSVSKSVYLSVCLTFCPSATRRFVPLLSFFRRETDHLLLCHPVACRPTLLCLSFCRLTTSITETDLMM